MQGVLEMMWFISPIIWPTKYHDSNASRRTTHLKKPHGQLVVLQQRQDTKNQMHRRSVGRYHIHSVESAAGRLLS